VLSADVPPGGTCDEKLCWSATKTGYKFRDRAGLNDGVTRVVLKGNDMEPKAKATVAGKGANLRDAVLPTVGTVTVQILNEESGFCIESVFGSDQIFVNDGEQLKAKAP
jgi:hypothetical protein